MTDMDLETLAALAKQPTVVRIEPGNVLVFANVGASFDPEIETETLSTLKQACGASVVAVFEDGVEVQTLESELARQRDELIAEVERLKAELLSHRLDFLRELREKARWHIESETPGDATLNDLAAALERKWTEEAQT